MLRLYVLGQPELHLDGVNWQKRTRVQRLLFLFYLTEAGAPVPRTDLAQLFWPQVETETGLTNLRSMTRRLRQEGLDAYLLVTRYTIGLNPNAPVVCDFLELRALLTQSDTMDTATLLKADALYQGDLFGDTVLDEYPLLAEWVEAHQRELELRMIQVYYELIPQLLARHETAHALKLGARLAEIAPYDDQAQLLYLRVLVTNHRVADALNHLNRYRRTMAREFPDVQLSPELDSFARRVHQPMQTVQVPQAAAAPSPETTSPALIGRSHETARLHALLDSGARLISVTGLVGIGKTTLVAGQLSRLRARFHPRLHLLDLRSHAGDGETDAQTLLRIVADVMELLPQSGAALYDQVRTALAASPVCLILDNFDVLYGAASLVATLVEQTPTLTVIVTSRQALHVKAEARLELSGLQVAADEAAAHALLASGIGQDDTSAAAEWSEGAQLFLLRVAQQHVNFDVGLLEKAKVEAFCRQLGGHPLALELAAAQLDFYGLDELREAVRKSLSLLSTQQPGQSDDHGNLNLLLDRMWAPLSPSARDVLAQLSVFAGTFHRHAMESVAPAPVAVYRELRNASLLQSANEPAWFSLHPLVKVKARAHLAPDDPVYGRHARRFLGLLDLGERMRASPQSATKEFIRRIYRRHLDIIAAWQWAVDAAEWGLLNRAIVSLSIYLERLNLRTQGVRLFRMVLDALPPAQKRSPEQQRLAGHAALFIGMYTVHQPGGESVEFCRQGVSWLRAAGDPWDLAAADFLAARVHLSSGMNWAEATALLQEAETLAEAHHFTELRVSIDLAQAAIDRYRGQWVALGRIEQQIFKRLADNLTADAVTVSLLHSAILGDWPQVQRIISTAEAGLTDRAISVRLRLWMQYYRCHLLVRRRRLSEAIELRRTLFEGFAVHDPFMLPLVYSEAALWYFMAEDRTQGRQMADLALQHIHRQWDPLTTHFGLCFVAAVALCDDDPAAADAYSRVVLAHGQATHDPIMLFSALYVLTRIHADRLSPDFVLRVLKIGTLSPAMHFTLRPLAQRYAAEQGINVMPNEREALWATDFPATEAMAAEFTQAIGGSGTA